MKINKKVLSERQSSGQVQDADANAKCYSELDDNRLLTLIGTDRDRKALAELYSRYQLQITRFLQRYTESRILIEEVYNDVMLTVWRKADGFRGDSKVSTWLFAIAYRTRQSHSRKENRHNHVEYDDYMVDAIAEEQAEDESQASVNEDLQAALLELSEEHRTVIELTYFHGYSTTEVADIVRVPQNTVKTRLFHARKNLKAALEAGQSNDADRGTIKLNKSVNNQRKSFAQQTHLFAQYQLFVVG